MKKILVIAPHADDEVLGLGGYLMHEISNGSDIYIVIVAMNDRDSEFEKAKKEMKIKNSTVLFPGKDAEMDTVPKKIIVEKFERLINSIMPDELFLPYPSSHQDHETAYKCGISAIRIRPGHIIPKVFLYEYPSVGGHFDYIYGGRYYHNITDVLKKKVSVFENCYKSQIKESPSSVNEYGIKTLAMIRGMECGFRYAEMFYLQRVIG